MKTVRPLILAVALALIAIGSVSAAPGAPVLVNPGFECDDGYHPQAGIRGLIPNGWTAQLLAGDPDLVSTRMRFYYVCDHDPANFVERLEGYDSFIFAAQDIETPPEPGKPFDALIYQQVAVTPGVAYSLSGWMVSLCGGSSAANPCPPDYYMAKMIGLDPTGGTNPLAGSVAWVEDRRNFTETRWLNMQQAARAQSSTLTVFARVRSPYRWHGNHAFADAFSVVRAPSAQIIGLPTTQPGRQVAVRWQGDLGPDIPAIPNGKYSLLFDMQYRAGGGAWADWLIGQPAGSATFQAPACGSATYAFRVRPRAEQLVSGGAWPNHRYPGVWSDPATVTFTQAACASRVYLPYASR